MSESMPVKLSVVIPVYRSQHTLPDLYRRIVAVLERVEPAFEIIFVEDCGGDDSWQVIESLAAEDPRVHGIKLSRNFGQHAATICGISKAKGDWVLTLDDDLEQPPEHIPDLIDKARAGYAVVYGVYTERSHHWWRNLTSDIARRMFRMAIPSLNYEYTSFRLIARSVAARLIDFDSPFPFVDGYLSWLTNNCATVVVRHGQRARGASNYNFRKLATHTINIFVTFSDLPLRMASWIGLCASFIGIVWLSYLLLRFFLGGITVSGYASVMAGIILFGGVQLLILGIFGEYLGRMNFKSSRKPLFLVAEDTKARIGIEASEA
jgi:glycosyltransferase involved in cell wall biosynthesis